jgi:arylsulfatase A-like enzyme
LAILPSTLFSVIDFPKNKGMKKIVLSVIFLVHAISLFAQHQKPNIIYIYADDLGYGELGSYGQKIIKTPNLDKMAKEGMRFTQHYSGAPVCAPSRCMLLTGKHPGHSYIRGNYEMGGFGDDEERGQMPLHDGAYTVAKMLKERGYVTALVGKWGMGVVGTTGSPLNHGFDYYYGYLDQKQAHNYYPTHLWENDNWDSLKNTFINVHQSIKDTLHASESDFNYYKGVDYAPDKMTNKALRFIEKSKATPFFLYLPYTLPHLSLQVPDSSVEMYRSLFDEKPYYGQKGYAATMHPRSTYAAMISYLDAQVGIIIQKVKSLGLDENTIIMFSSDNGATFSAGVDTKFFNSVSGLRGLKMDLYEGGIRVPFIVRWPGKIAPNTTTDHISVQYDIMPTLAELTGDPVQDLDGISLLPELKSNHQAQRGHQFLYFEYPENGGQVAIRMGKWKGVRRNIRKDPQSPWELYNLEVDLNEQNNVASSHAGIIAEMKSIASREHIHSHLLEWDFVDSKIKVRGEK